MQEREIQKQKMLDEEKRIREEKHWLLQEQAKKSQEDMESLMAKFREEQLQKLNEKA